MILVVCHEKLNAEMQRTYAKHITVVKVPKSGGVRPPLIYSPPLHYALAFIVTALLTYLAGG